MDDLMKTLEDIGNAYPKPPSASPARSFVPPPLPRYANVEQLAEVKRDVEELKRLLASLVPAGGA